MSSYDAVEVVQIMCTSAGPGSAALADSWASSFGLTNVQVWGDTTDYCAEVGSSRDAVRQVRDEVTRYQAAADLEAAVAALGEAEAGGVVSEEAVRQHAVFASK